MPQKKPSGIKQLVKNKEINVCTCLCGLWGHKFVYWHGYDIAQPSIGFTENGPKKRKYQVNGSCVDENALLMSEVRGEWADWLEMKERQQ